MLLKGYCFYILIYQLLLPACASTGRVDRLERRIDQLSDDSHSEITRLDQEVARLDQSEQNLERLLNRLSNQVHSSFEQHARAEDEIEGQIEQLRDELHAKGIRTVTVPSGANQIIIFGNHSGHDAQVWVTNKQRAVSHNELLTVQVRRIRRPSENKQPAEGSLHDQLPKDFETTNALDLTANGASRIFVVPCGYEVIANNSGRSTSLNLIVSLNRRRCTVQ